MKIRTLSTAFGIILGIAALTAAFNFTETARREILKSVEGLNTSLLVVKNALEPGNKISQSSPLTCYDLEVLLENVESLESGSPLVLRQVVIPPFLDETFPVIGAGSALFSMLNMKIQGRGFTEYENTHGEYVCVIGGALRKRLFGNRNAEGAFLRLWGADFLITGIAESGDKTPYADSRNSVYIPFPVMDRIASSQGFPEMLILKRRGDGESRELSEKIQGLISRNREGRNFEIWDQSEWISKKRRTVMMIEWLVGSVPMLILIVACISSANMLIVAVTERTKEIGLRIALGAAPGDILFLFLREGMLLFLGSGILGIILGYYLTLWFVKPLPSMIVGYQNWTFSFSYSSVMKSGLILLISGLASSLVPALKAARMEPSLALRYE